MLTSARKSEFALLRRIGATRRQLGSMIAIESGFVIVLALLIGTLAMLPALTGVAYGLLGALSVGIDWPVYAGLAAAVVLIAGVAIVGSARVGGVGGCDMCAACSSGSGGPTRSHVIQFVQSPIRRVSSSASSQGIASRQRLGKRWPDTDSALHRPSKPGFEGIASNLRCKHSSRLPAST